jgi:hypothetical protein
VPAAGYEVSLIYAQIIWTLIANRFRRCRKRAGVALIETRNEKIGASSEQAAAFPNFNAELHGSPGRQQLGYSPGYHPGDGGPSTGHSIADDPALKGWRLPSSAENVDEDHYGFGGSQAWEISRQRLP